MSRTLNILLVLVQIMMLSQLPAIAGPTPEAAATDARLTEAHGDVYKRAFTDWTKDALGDPSPASVGEVLHEGMQIGTGKNSWAQLQWRHMSARAWANSVYAISPSQRLVYLVGGEMLYQLDKNRGEHSPYYVWTNLLQARIRGTTVLFQATKTMSKITVLEGTVEVLNKVDHSVVTITPGTVYEIKSKSGSQSDSEAGTLTPITINSTPSAPVFETSKTIASVYSVDPMAVMNHGLLRDFETPLSSLPLITDALSSVQSKLENAGKNVLGAVTDILHDSLTITSVPRALNYLVGENIRTIAQIVPGTFDFFAPEGIVGKPQIAMLAGAVPGASLPSDLINTTALQRLTSQSVLQPAAASVTAITAVTSGIGATTTATVAGATALTSSQVANAGRLVAGVGGVVGGVGGTVGGVVGGVGGTLGGVVGGVGGTVGGVTGTLGGVVGGVGGVLGGVTGTLGGLLGH